MNRQLVSILSTLVGVALLGPSALAQVPMSTGVYSQNFNSLAASGTANTWANNVTLPGWQAVRQFNVAVTAYRAGTGSDNAGAIYSYGVAGSSDRALGSVASGSTSNLAYAVYFLNDTGAAQSGIKVSYVGEQWRNGGNTAQQQIFCDYQVSATAPALDADIGGAWQAFPTLDCFGPTFSATATALLGNDPTNQVAFTDVELTGVTVPAGQVLVLRWLDFNDAGNDHGLALDDLTVTFPGVSVVTNPPAIAAEPQSRTNNAGTAAAFSVTVTGTEPLSYQWRRDGVPLSDGGNIVGSQNPTLTISSLVKADEAAFDVIVTNVAGGATSIVASLTVIDPAINTQPAARTNLPGDVTSFSASGAGTAPVGYQWQHAGTPIPGATGSSYQITNVTPARGGEYVFVVSNSLGSVTSAPAVLTVIATPPERLAYWNFNDTNAPSTPDQPTIASGTGTATVIGGTGGAMVSGTSTDPGNLVNTNFGWNATNWPAQGTANKTAGVQFNVSTVGYTNLFIAWQERHSGTASKYVRFQYSLDGTTFTDQNIYVGPDSVFAQFTNDLSGVPGAGDNPNFAFRIVTEWESTATGAGSDVYLPTFAGSSYGTTGTIRFDMVSLFGAAISPPARPHITQIQLSSGNVIIDFEAGAADAASAFTLRGAAIVDGTYLDAGAGIVSLGGGRFRATVAAVGSSHFYRVSR
ncbi:MAG: hypothetical protein HZA90_12395 [Verrucomicrobia bacterium]|nr:hypothetical protein [Verrucomicrobiota bacterium]